MSCERGMLEKPGHTDTCTHNNNSLLRTKITRIADQQARRPIVCSTVVLFKLLKVVNKIKL